MLNRRYRALLLLVVVSGCAPASAGRAGGARQEAGRVPLDLAAVADTAALHVTLAADPFVRGGADTALVVIEYDSTGALVPPRVEHPAATEEDAERVRMIISETLAASGEPRARGWFTLTRGARPRLHAFEPVSEEMPRMLNRPEIGRALEQLAADPTLRDREMTVRLRVGIDGSVGEAMVVRSTGSIAADQALLDLARRVRFTPARLDWFPVSTWVQFPLQIREGWGRDDPPRPDASLGDERARSR